MIKSLHGVRGIARQISSAADSALSAYRDGRVEEEPQLTDRILGAIEDRVGSFTLYMDANPGEADHSGDPVSLSGLAARASRKFPTVE